MTQKPLMMTIGRGPSCTVEKTKIIVTEAMVSVCPKRREKNKIINLQKYLNCSFDKHMKKTAIKLSSDLV